MTHKIKTTPATSHPLCYHHT